MNLGENVNLQKVHPTILPVNVGEQVTAPTASARSQRRFTYERTLLGTECVPQNSYVETIANVVVIRSGAFRK